MEFKELDKEIYKKGFEGNLTIEEVDNLPEEYGYLKKAFKDRITLKKNKELLENTDEEVVAKGFSGELTHEEIDKLPNEYNGLKGSFHEWTMFMRRENGLSKFRTMMREFNVSKRIVNNAPKNKKGFSKFKEILKMMEGIKRNRNIGSPYTEDDVTPQEEIDKMLVPTPGDPSERNDPDWFHKAAINNKLRCVPVKK